ncbi:MAG: hypothetical protein ABSG35_14385 [Syntrophobacteraceae bacterium]
MVSEISNEDGEKICVTCRKKIDQAAIICPYCRSNAVYQSFLEIPSSRVIQVRRPVRFFIVICVALALAALPALFFFVFFGLFLACLMAGIVFGVIAHLAIWISGARGFDKLFLPCPKCDKEALYTWPAERLQPGKNGDSICPGCGCRVRVRIVP